MKNKTFSLKFLSMIFVAFFLTVSHNTIFNSTILNAQLSPIFKGNKIGYIDSTGTIIIPCLYETDINYDFFVVGGKTIIDFRIPNWARFNDGGVTVKIPRKIFIYTHSYTYAMLNEKGEHIFQPTENMIYGLSQGIAVYKRLFKNAQKVYDFNFSYVDLNQNFINEAAYSFAGSFNNGIALVIVDNSEYQYINRKGDKAFDIKALQTGNSKIDIVESFSDGLAAIKVDSLWGYIDTTGNWVIPPKFHSAFSFNDGLARVSDGRYFTYIDKKGQEITLYEFDFADNFSNGLGLVRKGMKFGYIDTIGELVIPFDYIYAQPFSEGLAAVYHNGSIAFIDTKGNIVINKKFDYAKGFLYGLARVWKNDELFYINKKGDIVHLILTKNQYRSKKSKMLKN